LLTQQVMSWLHSTIATEATGSNDAARAAQAAWIDNGCDHLLAFIRQNGSEARDD